MSEVARKLTEIYSSSVESNVLYSNNRTIYRVRLPYIPIFRSEYETGDASPHLDYLNVPCELRGNRIATRLVSSMAWLLTRDEHRMMHSEVSSVHTVKIFRNLFGAQSLIFREPSGNILSIDQNSDIEALNISRNNQYSITVNISNPVQALEPAQQVIF